MELGTQSHKKFRGWCLQILLFYRNLLDKLSQRTNKYTIKGERSNLSKSNIKTLLSHTPTHASDF